MSGSKLFEPDIFLQASYPSAANWLTSRKLPTIFIHFFAFQRIYSVQ